MTQLVSLIQLARLAHIIHEYCMSSSPALCHRGPVIIHGSIENSFLSADVPPLSSAQVRPEDNRRRCPPDSSPYLGDCWCTACVTTVSYVLLQPRSISFDAMSINPSPELKSLFEAALNEFEKRAGANLVQHQIVDKLVNCDSADSVVDVLQEQARAFRNFRGDDGKLMRWLKRTVSVLYTLSASGLLGEGIGLVCLYSVF
jgi:hypothetical protein